MADNNIVILRGHLADDPYLETMPSGAPHLRFFLLVERSTSQMPRSATGKEIQKTDLLRVVRYGQQAETDNFYLRKGASIVVFGWNQSRLYVDRRSGKEVRRLQQEVNAQLIFYGRNCNFERGDRHQADQSSRPGQPSAQGDVADMMADQVLRMLAAGTADDR